MKRIAFHVMSKMWRHVTFQDALPNFRTVSVEIRSCDFVGRMRHGAALQSSSLVVDIREVALYDTPTTAPHGQDVCLACATAQSRTARYSAPRDQPILQRQPRALSKDTKTYAPFRKLDCDPWRLKDEGATSSAWPSRHDAGTLTDFLQTRHISLLCYVVA